VVAGGVAGSGKHKAGGRGVVEVAKGECSDTAKRWAGADNESGC